MHGIDRAIAEFDLALRTIAGVRRAERPSPADELAEGASRDAECAQAAALMRVNHVGAVCAQALYQGQALVARNPDNCIALALGAAAYPEPVKFAMRAMARVMTTVAYRI